MAAATAGMVVSWSCELCGRLFATRDEWSAHAKSHLPDNKLLQDKMQQASQHQVTMPPGYYLIHKNKMCLSIYMSLKRILKSKSFLTI